MKILWVNGSPLPEFAEHLHLSHGGGLWLVRLSKKFKSQNYTELFIICAVSSKSNEVNITIDGIHYIGIYSPNNPCCYSKQFTEKVFEVLTDVQPDIIHIWGTENEYSYCSFRAVEKAEMRSRTVVSIQGLVSVIAKHYLTGIPLKYVYGYSISELIRRKNLLKQKKIFELRGKYEEYVINNCANIIGRTSWDRYCCSIINPDVNYYIDNETLRDSFYKDQWNVDKCKRHSIFMSSSEYPVKGLHIMLEALGLLKQQFPDVHLYVPGKDRLDSDFKHRIKFNSYDHLLCDLIKRYGLEKHITFLGYLSEKEMKTQYLSSNVFVSSSVIENSSNAIGEAMILGVPTVASCVGGVQSLLKDGEEGFLFSIDAPYMLAGFIMDFFKDDNLCKKISHNEINRASSTHNLENNYNQLMNIYKTMIGNTQQ